MDGMFSLSRLIFLWLGGEVDLVLILFENLAHLMKMYVMELIGVDINLNEGRV